MIQENHGVSLDVEMNHFPSRVPQRQPHQPKKRSTGEARWVKVMEFPFRGGENTLVLIVVKLAQPYENTKKKKKEFAYFKWVTCMVYIN